MPKKLKAVIPKVYKFDERFYQIGDEYYPRVTHILDSTISKPALLAWYARWGADGAEKRSQEALDRGSRIHEAVHRLLLGDVVNLDVEFPAEDEKKMLLGFVAWFEEYQPKDIISEHTVWSKKHKIAGTLDMICKLGKKTILVDVKTSSAIYPEYALQLAAYKEMVKENSTLKPTEMYVLRLVENSKSHFEFKEVKASFADFLAVKRIFDYLNPKLAPREQEEFPREIRLFEKKGKKKK